jgi:hypothetical protein
MKAAGVLSRTKSETYVEPIVVEWLYERLFSWGQVTKFSEKILSDQV